MYPSPAAGRRGTSLSTHPHPHPESPIHTNPTPRRRRTASSLLLAGALAVGAFLALPAPEASAQLGLELESDPMAFALDGFSLHGAALLGPARISVGAFGIEVPEFFHGNRGWDASMRGTGIKLDYLGSSPEGWFVGLDAGYMRMHYTFAGHPEVEKRHVLGAGARAGYRWFVGDSGLYLVPWMSATHSFDGEAVRIAGSEFERPRITLFPTLHVGWRF